MHIALFMALLAGARTPATTACTPPTAVIGTPSTSICRLMPVQLQGSGGVQCQWFPSTDLDNPASCTPLATIHETTTYTLVVTDANGCASTNTPPVTIKFLSADPTMYVATNTLPNTTYSGFVQEDGPDMTYAWSATGGVTINGPSNQRTITYTTSCSEGDLAVTVTNTDGCSNSEHAHVRLTYHLGMNSITPLLANPGTLMTVTGMNLRCMANMTVSGRPVPFYPIGPNTVTFIFPPFVGSFAIAETADDPAVTPFVTFHRRMRDSFDTSSTSAVLWRNANDGTTLLWLMWGGQLLYTATPYLRPAGSTDYVLVGNDQTGDGYIAASVLWQRTSTRELITQYLRHTSAPDAEVVWKEIPPATLRVAATADLDDDGAADLLMRDTQTGATSLWHRTNDSVIKTPIHPGNNLDWSIVGARDFDFDGIDDILWRNNVSGMTLIWFMNGTTIRSSQVVHYGGNTDWSIAGTSDFDGDGYSDILWRHKSSGMTLLWRMNGSSITSSQVVHSGGNTNWDIAALGDYDADARADVLWREKSSGQTLIWLMNGASITASMPLHSGGNLDWSIVKTSY
jgi:hypothetical protein